jgi:hypothetical protein
LNENDIALYGTTFLSKPTTPQNPPEKNNNGRRRKRANVFPTRVQFLSVYFLPSETTLPFSKKQLKIKRLAMVTFHFIDFIFFFITSVVSPFVP